MTVSCMYSENFRKSMKNFFNRKFVQKFTLFSLKPLIIFAIIPLVGNNFKTKIFSLLKQIYGGLSQDSIWGVGDLTEPI